MGTCRIVEFPIPADHRVKLKKIEKKDKYLDVAREEKKTVEHESKGYTNCRWCSSYNHQRFGKGTRRLGNKIEDYPDVEIGKNTEKSPGDLRRNAVTQT